MRARRPRTLNLVATGAGAALALATLAGCASGTVQPGASTTAATTTAAATASTTAPASTPTPEPTRSSTPTAGVPTAGATNGSNALTAPAAGSTVDGPDVLVTGTGTGFEATLSWEAVPAAGGDPVAHGFTTAGANGEVGPFTFTATLPPGSYTLSVWEPDMSDGATGTKRHDEVSVTFTVR